MSSILYYMDKNHNLKSKPLPCIQMGVPTVTHGNVNVLIRPVFLNLGK